MRVKDLRAALEGLDDNLLVVTEGSDHSYRDLDFAVRGFAEASPEGYLYEYWNDENMGEGSKKVEVFVVD